MSTPGFEETSKTLKRGREENREERKKKPPKHGSNSI